MSETHKHAGSTTVGVVGLGYVGLPLAVAFAEAGFRVVGVDLDRARVKALADGDAPIEGVDEEGLRELLRARKVAFTEDYGDLGEAEAVFICLPTPLNANREPDLSIVVAGAEAVHRNLRPGALVVLESTTYPGTTREVLLPILEEGGRRVDEDFGLAFSPERIDPGNERYTLKNTPKVVGGMTPGCSRRAAEIYGAVVEEVHEVSSPESAELSKLLENIFRGVNIALVNELAVLCHRMGIDVWEVVGAAATKPFGFMPFYPGPGLGGHCIPVDPSYLSWKAREYDMNAKFIELAGETNVGMPYHAVDRVAASLNARKKPVMGSRVLMLGVAYKPNVGDVRESPSLKMLSLLDAAGAEVVYHDPHVRRLGDHASSASSFVELTEEELERADCVVIATDHDAVDLERVVRSAPNVLDLRNAVRRRTGELPANVEVL